MKYLLPLLVIIAMPALADGYQQGYVKDNGTYVPPHYRTDIANRAFNPPAPAQERGRDSYDYSPYKDSAQPKDNPLAPSFGR